MASAGRLSNKHKKFIADNAGMMTDDEIAKEIGKTEAMVTKYRVFTLGKGDDLTDSQSFAAKIRCALHAEPHWPLYQSLYTAPEIIYFENKWVEYFTQFRDDVWATEKMQIVNMIDLEISKMRVSKEEKTFITEIAAVQHEINRQLEHPIEIRDNNLLSDCMGQKISLGLALKNSRDEKNGLLMRIDAIVKMLKGTRDQRIAYLEKAGAGFMGLLSRMVDPKFRDEEGREMELIRRAVAMEKRRLGEYHEYEDGSIDRPLLSDATIKIGGEDE